MEEGSQMTIKQQPTLDEQLAVARRPVRHPDFDPGLPIRYALTSRSDGRR
ncbi:hypothetical protein [Bradyrhizobium sp. CB3481]|nr:hypothetical protein [Bradyrhizobium sp. CB3481]WFU18549.1 hypothetical protein QA643_09490 [Bradyrhizobium sp. CB3481]